MSTAILTLSESGELQKIHDKWLKRKGCRSQSPEGDSEQLQLNSFWGLFLICGIACSLALAIYFCLMLRRFNRFSKHFPELSEPASTCGISTHYVRLQRFLSFADEKAEVSKSKLKRKRMETLSIGSRVEIGSRYGSKRIQADMSDQLGHNSGNTTWFH